MSFAVYELTGVIVDLVLVKDTGCIQYVVVAFDAGPGELTVYQPVSWNLLRRAGRDFVVNASAEDAHGLPEALHVLPLHYGGNSRPLNKHAVPTPQSTRVH